MSEADVKMNNPRSQRTWERIKRVMAQHPEGLTAGQIGELAFVSKTQVRCYMMHFNVTAKAGNGTTPSTREVYIKRREVVGHSVCNFWALGKLRNAPEWPKLTRDERRKLTYKERRAKLKEDPEEYAIFLARMRQRTRLWRLLKKKDVRPIHPFMFKPREEQQMQG